MTDKEKIKAELERRMYDDYNSGEAEVDCVAQGVCASMIQFIDSLQEEPKPKFRKGNKVIYLNEEYVVEDITDHYILRSTRERTSVPVVHIGFGNEDYELRLVEEPASIWHDASEEPKPNMELICVGQYGNPLVLSSNSDSFKSRYISKWAYFNDLLNLSNVERTVKDWKEEPVRKLELDENGEPILTPFESELFSMMSDAWQGYMSGEEVNIAKIVKEHSAELLQAAVKEQLLKDAVRVEVKIDAGGYPYIPAVELYDYDKEVFLACEGDKVKVKIIKED